MEIKPFFDHDTATFTYVVSDPTTLYAAVIDSVLNYDQFSGTISTKSADEVIDYINENNFKLQWILETHIHADHITAASYIKQKIGGLIGIGSKIKDVLNFWIPVFNTFDDTPSDCSQFDKTFDDGETFHIGSIKVKVSHTPGHTPACVVYVIEDCVFAGDTIFMPDLGTSRTDFPGGDATQLYNSIQKILSLPDDTKIYSGHDYPNGRELSYMSTVLEQKQKNILVNENISAQDYVLARNKKDENKPVPKLLHPAIQVNLRAGSFGKKENNGKYYVKIPVNGMQEDMKRS